MKNFFFLILMLTAYSCSPANEKKTESQSESATVQPSLAIGSVAAESGENGSYAYFIPDSNEHYPLIIFLDPHSDGNFVLNKYVELAKAYKVIMLASNDSRNGLTFDQSNSIVSHLLVESNKFKVKRDRITLVGFSGGAKAALVASTVNSEVLQVVYCGAAFPPGTIQLNKPSIGIAGKADMNYSEVVQFYKSVNSTDKALIFREGKHEWPEKQTFEQIFQIISKDNKQPLENLKNDLESKIKSSKNILEKAEMINELAYAFKGNPERESYLNQFKNILSSNEYKIADSKFRTDIETEEKEKDMIGSAFEQRNIEWMTTKIEALNKSSKPIDKRLLGFFSLAAYSYSNRALQTNDLSDAEKMLLIYRLADPENNEQIFMHAKLFARKNEIDSAREYKIRAIEKGFDRGKAAADVDVGKY